MSSLPRVIRRLAQRDRSCRVRTVFGLSLIAFVIVGAEVSGLRRIGLRRAPPMVRDWRAIRTFSAGRSVVPALSVLQDGVRLTLSRSALRSRARPTTRSPTTARNLRTFRGMHRDTRRHCGTRAANPSPGNTSARSSRPAVAWTRRCCSTASRTAGKRSCSRVAISSTVDGFR